MHDEKNLGVELGSWIAYATKLSSHMTDAHLTIRLRPTRIGFLVNPTDMVSVRRVMRYCTCLWGGHYNPIIPVFRNPPKEWRPERFDRVTGYDVARGYIRFFEPDVFVEATAGLADKVGLSSLRDRLTYHSQIVSLDDFLVPRDHRVWAEPAFGLSIVDVFRHLYEAEQRFQHRKPREVLSIKPDRTSGVAEAVFGVFPSGKFVDYIAKAYKDVFNPTSVPASAETWKKAFEGYSLTPLRVTGHGTETQRFWHHDVVVFVFDPAKPTDLIDLWNLRLEPNPVLPVPVDWFEDVSDFVKRLLNETHRPVQGNRNGVMHRATVEFGRSLSMGTTDRVVKTLSAGVDKGALCIKTWRNRVWVKHVDQAWVAREHRMLVTADERRVTVPIKENQGELSTTFEALSPPFASKVADNDCRWINAVGFSVHGNHHVATVFPFNMYDRSWPRLGFGGGHVLVGSEGWIFGQRYENSSENLKLMRSEEALIGTLKQYGIEAKLSDPGHIAQQMLQNLNGLWGTHLLADANTLQLLNKMAGGLRRKSNETDIVEEHFDRKTVSRKDWLDLIAKRVAKNRLPRLKLADFTDRRVIRLGLETDCPNCQATNWHGLDDVGYDLTCERCLKAYAFPQADLREQNKNWAYRVIGPFSVPDYGRGAYSVLLTLRALAAINISHDTATFSTALALKVGDKSAEIDFAVLRDKNGRFDHNSEPEFLVGEAKSFGSGDLVKAKDLDQLKLVASKLPNAYVVISVLRNSFTRSEIKRLKSFVQWGRRPNIHGQPTNPVILLTGVELFAAHYIQSEWKNLPEPYKSLSDYNSIRTLHGFADATQQIYLGMPAYYKWREAVWKKRAEKKKAAV
ncbi:MAG: hypothetical protein K2Q28_02535 [Hyphomicrobium sp.]|nr:hypothetical protein [Hyphomicrobium sp.]